MKNRVTVVPQDKILIVDGELLKFDFPYPENLHALQWNGANGHIEFTDAANTLLSAEDYEKYVLPFVVLWEEEKKRILEEEAKPPPVPTLAESKISKLQQINTEYESRASLVRIGVPENEVLTWDIQKLEAEAWQVNSEVDTPFITTLAESRGVDRDALLGKVLEKVTAYRTYVGGLTGVRQRLEDSIVAATTLEEVEKIVWPE